MDNRTGLFTNAVIWFGVAISVSEIQAGIQIASASLDASSKGTLIKSISKAIFQLLTIVIITSNQSTSLLYILRNYATDVCFLSRSAYLPYMLLQTTERLSEERCISRHFSASDLL